MHFVSFSACLIFLWRCRKDLPHRLQNQTRLSEWVHNTYNTEENCFVV